MALEIVAQNPELVAAPGDGRGDSRARFKLRLNPLPEPSLGSALIANGIVGRPRAAQPDPLASIRRLSQTEKIALFS